MSKELEALKDIKELFTCHDFDLLEKCSVIEKALKAYGTLLEVLFGPYVYNDGCGSDGWYLIGPMPGEVVEIPITKKDAEILMQAGFEKK